MVHIRNFGDHRSYYKLLHMYIQWECTPYAVDIYIYIYAFPGDSHVFHVLALAQATRVCTTTL